MSPIEYTQMVRWIRDRWPGTKNWHASSLASDFQNIPAKHAMAALREYQDDESRNAHAPKAPQVRTRAMQLMRESSDRPPGELDCDIKGHHGPLAIMAHDDREKAAEGMRIAICVLCHTEFIGDEKRYPTVGEVAAANAEGREAPDRIRGSRYDRSDRIAP